MIRTVMIIYDVTNEDDLVTIKLSVSFFTELEVTFKFEGRMDVTDY